MSTTNETGQAAPASGGWKIVKTHVSGVFHYEEAKAAIADPWQLPKVKAQALRLALLGWRPAARELAEERGVTPGWADLYRAASRDITGPHAVQELRYWVIGTVVFIHKDDDAALYCELMSGTLAKRENRTDAEASVHCVPLGLRWLGGIVEHGDGGKARARQIARDLAAKHRHKLLTDHAWVQVAYRDKRGQLHMPDLRVKDLMAEPTRQPAPVGKARPIRPEVLGKGGKWRKIRAVDAAVYAQTASIQIGVHAFNWERRDDGYAYLTVHGGVEPHYRIDDATMQELFGEGYRV